MCMALDRWGENEETLGIREAGMDRQAGRLLAGLEVAGTAPARRESAEPVAAAERE